MLQTVLNNKNNLDKNVSYEFFTPLFGMGLFTAPGKIYLQKEN